MTRLQRLAYMAVERMNLGISIEYVQAGLYFELVTAGASSFFIKFAGFDIANEDSFTDQEFILDRVEDDEKASGYVQWKIIAEWKMRLQTPLNRMKTVGYTVSPETQEAIDSIPMFNEAMQSALILKDPETKKSNKDIWYSLTTPDIISKIKGYLSRWENKESGMDIHIANYCLFNHIIRTNLGPKAFIPPPSLMEAFKEEEEPEVLDSLPLQPTHYFKEKPYRVFTDSKIKLAGIIAHMEAIVGREFLRDYEKQTLENAWMDIVIYQGLSNEGNKAFWAREKNEFNSKFEEIVNQGEGKDLVDDYVNDIKELKEEIEDGGRELLEEEHDAQAAEFEEVKEEDDVEIFETEVETSETLIDDEEDDSEILNSNQDDLS